MDEAGSSSEKVAADRVSRDTEALLHVGGIGNGPGNALRGGRELEDHHEGAAHDGRRHQHFHERKAAFTAQPFHLATLALIVAIRMSSPFQACGTASRRARSRATVVTSTWNASNWSGAVGTWWTAQRRM